MTQAMTQTRVEDAMTWDVPAVHVSTPFKEIARTLSSTGVGALAVIDAGRRVIGVVSAGDLLARSECHRRHRAARRHRTDDRIHIPGEDGTARALMTSPAVTATVDQSVYEAARIALERDVRQLPVVDSEGRLRGMVTRVQLLRPFLRSDPAIGDEIVQRVIGDQFCLDPATVDVTVREGVVTLRGFLESPLLHEPLVDAVRAVEGVVAVRSKLTCGRGEERLAPVRRPMY